MQNLGGVRAGLVLVGLFVAGSLVVVAPASARVAAQAASCTPAPTPQGVAVDVAGNVYTTQFNMVFRFTSAGTQTLVIQGPPFHQVTGVAVDDDGIIWVSDRFSGVFAFDASGNQILQIGLQSPDRLYLTYGVAVPQATGSLIAVWALGLLQVGQYAVALDPDGDVLAAAPTINGPLHLSKPTGVAVDQFTRVWIADPGNTTVLGYPGTLLTATAVTPNWVCPSGVAVNAMGDTVYVADYGSKTVYQLTWNPVTQGVTIPATAATPNFVQPFGVALDVAGNIYVADSGTNLVYEFNAAGVQTRTFQGDPTLLGEPPPVGLPDPVTTVPVPTAVATTPTFTG